MKRALVLVVAAVTLALAADEARADTPTPWLTMHVKGLITACVAEVRSLSPHTDFDAFLKNLESDGTATWAMFGAEFERFKFFKCMKTRADEAAAIPSHPDYKAPRGATK